MLRVENLSYSYGSQRILTRLSFELSPGEIVALVGCNGAGKSTLLCCLAGWLKLEEGAVYLNGRNLHRYQRSTRRHLVFVPDVPEFYDELTAWEHLKLIANLYQIPNWAKCSVELLEAFQLMNVRQSFPFILSRGMRHKLALCMAFLVRPQILLLDEPFGALDANSNDVLWRELMQLRSRESHILLSSHMLPPGNNPDRFLFLQEQKVQMFPATQVNSIATLLNA